MTASKLVLSAASGVGGGGGLNVEEVFSTYIYDGTGAAKTITNGIDLDGEGGLVWIKNREQADDHYLGDSERGFSKRLESNNTDAQVNNANGTWSFNSDGFTIPNFTQVNTNGEKYCSWTFRKAEKFFDVVTYTGTGSYQGGISHNLGANPGMIIVKRTDSTGNWVVWHRGTDPKNLQFNSTGSGSTEYAIQDVTSTTFGVTNYSTLKASESGATYVAYLFAHNNSDGEFGSTADQDIIKCGSYTGNGSASNGTEVDLGFEPQWVMIKPSTSTGGWVIFDNMRGIVSDGTDQRFQAQSNQAEYSFHNALKLQANGFKLESNGSNYNASGTTYVYMAIRRGPMAVPESATDVFGMDTLGGTSPTPPAWNSGFPVDMGIYRLRTSTSNFILNSRLNQGKRLMTNAADAESSESAAQFDYMNGYYDSTSVNSNYIDWMWRRAPNYFDVVAFEGTGSARTVSHNLGVAPEMIWVKNRIDAVDWTVYHKDEGATKRGFLNGAFAFGTGTHFNNTAPTETVFSVGTQGVVNGSGDDMIAYLFASLDGISKVGSYTGTGSTQTIDCGFSSGARFVLIKCTNAAENWIVFDSERGIVSGNDPYLSLNTTDAEISSSDLIDPVSSGFAVNTNFGEVNNSSNTYIFYAIA